MSASFIAFLGAAALVTIAPGLDTALVLRTAAVEGARRAFLAGLGVALGCLAWAGMAAIGVGALLAASEAAYTALKWAGAAYLLWLGVKLLLRPRERFDFAAEKSNGAPLARGFLTNILNPKVGVFYVSFLPQFVPPEAPAGIWVMGLGAVHAAMGLFWFALLIAATRPLARLFQRSAFVKTIDRLTGGVFLSFGAALALESRH